MSITVQSRAWTEGKIRGNLCVLANNRKRGIISRGQGATLHYLSLSFSLCLSPPRALTLWPQFRIISFKVKSISPSQERQTGIPIQCNLWYTYIRKYTMLRRRVYPSSWNDKRYPYCFFLLLFFIFILFCILI